MAASWNWFWYILVGFILGGGTVYLGLFLKDKTIKFKWYEWVLTVLAFVLFLFFAQTFIASFGEGEPRAAWMSLLFLGLPIILIAVGTFRLVQKRLQKAH
jgi:uncharacterized membrane protein